MSLDIYDRVAMQMFGRLYDDLFPAQQARVLVVAGEQLLNESKQYMDGK